MAKNLSKVQLQAALLLATGERPATIAEEMDIPEATLDQWTRDPDFAAHLDHIRDELEQAAVDRLRGLAGMSVDTLQRLMADDNPELVRLQAALAVLRFILQPPPFNPYEFTGGPEGGNGGLTAHNLGLTH